MHHFVLSTFWWGRIAFSSSLFTPNGFLNFGILFYTCFDNCFHKEPMHFSLEVLWFFIRGDFMILDCAFLFRFQELTQQPVWSLLIHFWPFCRKDCSSLLEKMQKPIVSIWIWLLKSFSRKAQHFPEKRKNPVNWSTFYFPALEKGAKQFLELQWFQAWQDHWFTQRRLAIN